MRAKNKGYKPPKTINVNSMFDCRRCYVQINVLNPVKGQFVICPECKSGHYVTEKIIKRKTLVFTKDKVIK